MADKKWTPEPWEVGELSENHFLNTNHKYAIFAKGKATGVVGKVEGKGVGPRADAARIVACVNGCEGINPEAVKDLLAACKLMLETWEMSDDGLTGRGAIAAQEACRAAISKAEATQ